MKKIIFYTILLLIAPSLIAQTSNVGINTNDPKGVFHIDSQGNTQSGNIVTDDVIITEDGNVGIGTITPTQKLEIASGNALITGNDSIMGNVTVNNIIVNDTLRINGTDLNGLQSPLEILSDEPKTAFRLNDGSQIVNDDLSLVDMIPTLTADAAGNLMWSNLKTLTDFKSANLKVNQRIGNYSSALIDITETGGMQLTEGVWLIMAEIATFTSMDASVSTNGFYVYLVLTNDSDPNTTIAVIGAPSESSGWGVSTPQLTYLLKVPAGGATYRIKASTSITSSKYVTTGIYGNPYFFAVKLDYQN